MEYQILSEKVTIDEKTLEGTSYLKGGIDHPRLFEFAIGEFEKFEDNDVFIDVGANIGLFSLLIKKGTAIAFEPVPETYFKLVANCRLNSQKNIIPILFALHSEIKRFDILYDPKVDGCNKIVIDEAGTFTTQVLDNLLIKKIRLLKIDAEGMDFEILRGAEKIIDRFHPSIIIEIDKCDSSEVTKFLKAKGYTFEFIGGTDLIAK